MGAVGVKWGHNCPSSIYIIVYRWTLPLWGIEPGFPCAGVFCFDSYTSQAPPKLELTTKALTLALSSRSVNQVLF